MNKLSFKLTKNLLNKVFLVFMVGLVSRTVINSVLDTNIGMEYSNYISIVYYFSMFCFSAIVCELPSVNLSVLTLNWLKM